MTEWVKDGIVEETNQQIGGTMRLGSYPSVIEKDTLIHKIYKATEIIERHRHRYAFNISFKEQFEKAGIIFSGYAPDNNNVTEIIELPKHPYFVGVQFHPELKSRIFDLHPLFVRFVKESVKNKQN